MVPALIWFVSLIVFSRSRVNTAAARPYIPPLAFSTTSSRVLNLEIAITGPKIYNDRDIEKSLLDDLLAHDIVSRIKSSLIENNLI